MAWIFNPFTGLLDYFRKDSEIDHGSIGGLADDDHGQYLLASDATDRATFATDWEDLTDGGQTALHSHAGGGASPLTTKGDLYGYNTDDARIPVGSDGQVLAADSTESLGVKWVSSVQEFDGGTFSDTYVDTADFDAGAFA